MATTKLQIGLQEVRRVQEQFKRWRSVKEGRERIPPKLWGLAAGLCETYRLHWVARQLGLNHTALKVEFDKRSHQRSREAAAAAAPAFVELSPINRLADHPAGMASGQSSAEYMVEAVDPRFGVPRIVVRGASASEVAALVWALREGSGGGSPT
jgi:hypothetical protein